MIQEFRTREDLCRIGRKTENTRRREGGLEMCLMDRYDLKKGKFLLIFKFRGDFKSAFIKQ